VSKPEPTCDYFIDLRFEAYDVIVGQGTNLFCWQWSKMNKVKEGLQDTIEGMVQEPVKAQLREDTGDF
jgi:hypothetical protein